MLLFVKHYIVSCWLYNYSGIELCLHVIKSDNETSDDEKRPANVIIHNKNIFESIKLFFNWMLKHRLKVLLSVCVSEEANPHYYEVVWITHLLIMESRAFCLLMLCCFITVCNLHPLNLRPSNGLRLCRKNSSLPALEVLPGGGWDNLRNIDMGRVMNLSYSQCQTTEDGVYFIPDEVLSFHRKWAEWKQTLRSSCHGRNRQALLLNQSMQRFPSVRCSMQNSPQKPTYENPPSERQLCNGTSSSRYKSKKK